MLAEHLIVREGGKLLSPGQSVTCWGVSPGGAVQAPTHKRSSLAISSHSLLSHRLGCTVSVGLGAEDSTWHMQDIPSPCIQATAPWPCLGFWTLCKALQTSWSEVPQHCLAVLVILGIKLPYSLLIWMSSKWMVSVKYTWRSSTPLCWDTNPHPMSHLINEGVHSWAVGNAVAASKYVSFLKQVTEYENAVACCRHWGWECWRWQGEKEGKN